MNDSKKEQENLINTANDPMIPYNHAVGEYMRTNESEMIRKDYRKYLLSIAKDVPICVDRSNGEIRKVNIFINESGYIVLENVGSVIAELDGEELILTDYKYK
jgi:hypothetical protein